MFVFFKQKTAYELRISDWSSDVCSSDLFTIKLLTAKPCAAIARRDMLEERGRQIVAVVASLAPRRRNGSIDKHRLDQRDRPRRRRHQRPWRAAQPQAQLKIVPGFRRSEEHTSELQSLMRISYAVFCLKKKKKY